MSQSLEKFAVATRGPLDAVVRVPGSKSITNRVLLIAALADGSSELTGRPRERRHPRDARRGLAMAWACESARTKPAGLARRRRRGRALRTRRAAHRRQFGDQRALPHRSSGAGRRARRDRRQRQRMRERPIVDLVDALQALSVPVEILGENGCPPVRVGGGGLPGGEVVVDASRSSQYVSALLLAAPYAARDLTIRFRDGIVVSRPYIDLTLQNMRAFGARAELDPRRHGTPGSRRATRTARAASRSNPTPRRPPTRSAPPRSRAVGCGSRMSRGLDPGRLCPCSACSSGWAAGCGAATTLPKSPAPKGRLAAIDVDMNDFPDAVLALAVVALFADGETRIRNVANLRIKETDRLAALETELRKLGADAQRERRLPHDPPRGAARRRNRHLRRPPDGHGIRPGRAARSRVS